SSEFGCRPVPRRRPDPQDDPVRPNRLVGPVCDWPQNRATAGPVQLARSGHAQTNSDPPALRWLLVFADSLQRHPPGWRFSFVHTSTARHLPLRIRAVSLPRMSRLPPRLSSAADALLASAVVVNLGWTTWCLGGYRPETMAVSAPLLLLTLTCAWLRRLAVGGPRFPWWVWAWPLPFLGYGLLNACLISPVPWLGWLDWSLWLHLFAAYWVGLELSGSRLAPRILAVSVAVISAAAVGLAVYQRLCDPAWLPMGRRQVPQYLTRSGGPFGIPNSFAAFLLLTIAPILACATGHASARWRRVAAGVVGLVLVIGLGLTLSRGAWLSFIAAAMLAPLLMTGRTWRWRLGVSGAVALLAVLTAAVAYTAVPSVKGRLDALRMDRGERTRPIMWRISWDLFWGAPATGTGAGSYRVLLERHRPEHFNDWPKWTHRDYLNALGDYGALGFILVFAAGGAFVVAVRRCSGAGNNKRDCERLGFEVALVTFALSLLFDFHLKIPAIAQLLGLVMAAWTAACFRDVERTRPTVAHAWCPVAAACVLCVMTVVWVRPRWYAEGLRYAARQRIDALAGVSDPARLRQVIEPEVAALHRATRTDPSNAEAWSDLSFALSQRGHYSAESAADIG